MGRTVPFVAAALAAATCLALSAPAGAQDKYPSKPIRVVVPYAPGGAVDIVARIVTDQMRQTLGQAFVIENKPGAFGIIGIEEMARAKPDGYTLMVGNVNANAITPVLFAKKFTINYEKDVVPVARLADVPAFLIANKDFPAKNFAEFVAYAKKNPGKVRFGSVGVGSFPQYDMEILARRIGTEMVHIPNKAGASGMLNDLVSGDTHVAFLNMATATAMVRAGQLRPLAIITEQRMPDYPDLPTMAELGFPGIGTLQWLALYAPSGVPKEILETLHRAAAEAVETQAVKDKFKLQAIRSMPTSSPADAAQWMAKEIADWKRITDEVKIDLTD